MDEQKKAEFLKQLHNTYEKQMRGLSLREGVEHAHKAMDTFFEDVKDKNKIVPLEAVAAANDFVSEYNKKAQGTRQATINLHFMRDEKGNVFCINSDNVASKIVSGKDLVSGVIDTLRGISISSTEEIHDKAVEIAGDSKGLKALASLLNDGTKVTNKVLAQALKDMLADKKISPKEEQMLALFKQANLNLGVSLFEEGKAIVYDRRESPSNDGFGLQSSSKGGLSLGYGIYTIDKNHLDNSDTEKNPITLGDLTPQGAPTKSQVKPTKQH